MVCEPLAMEGLEPAQCLALNGDFMCDKTEGRTERKCKKPTASSRSELKWS